jgi:hypothetical protein
MEKKYLTLSFLSYLWVNLLRHNHIVYGHVPIVK